MTSVIKTLVVDDVALARQRVVRLLKEHADVEVVGEAEDGQAMAVEIERWRPDLVVLDISMPEQDGFSAMAGVPEAMRPLVIVLTAYSEHALRAFRANAVDYLVKPVDAGSMAEALNRVRSRLGQPVVAESPRPTSPIQHRLALRTSTGLQLVNASDIVWVDAIRNYIAVHAAGQPIVIRSGLREFVQDLDQDIFVQIHRSSVVNLLRIAQVSTLPNGSHCLRLDTGKELVVSRKYWSSLIDKLGPAR